MRQRVAGAPGAELIEMTSAKGLLQRLAPQPVPYFFARNKGAGSVDPPVTLLWSCNALASETIVVTHTLFRFKKLVLCFGEDILCRLH